MAGPAEISNDVTAAAVVLNVAKSTVQHRSNERGQGAWDSFGVTWRGWRWKVRGKGKKVLFPYNTARRGGIRRLINHVLALRVRGYSPVKPNDQTRPRDCICQS